MARDHPPPGVIAAARAEANEQVHILAGEARPLRRGRRREGERGDKGERDCDLFSVFEHIVMLLWWAGRCRP